jgi:hypothetical protein
MTKNVNFGFVLKPSKLISHYRQKIYAISSWVRFAKNTFLSFPGLDPSTLNQKPSSIPKPGETGRIRTAPQKSSINLCGRKRSHATHFQPSPFTVFSGPAVCVQNESVTCKPDESDRIRRIATETDSLSVAADVRRRIFHQPSTNHHQRLGLQFRFGPRTRTLNRPSTPPCQRALSTLHTFCDRQVPPGPW